MFANIAKLASMAAGRASGVWRGMGAAGRAATTGAAIGGAYGAISDDTSILGGAAMGAVGGLGVRWGKAGLRAARGRGSASYGSAFLGGASRRFMRDMKGPSMLANKGINRVGSSLKGWTGGMSPL